jgi:hypothetical protein
MKRLILLVAMFSTLFVSTAFAIIPIIYFVASAAIHVGVVGGLTWYALSPASGSKSVTDNSVGSPATVQWVDLTGPAPMLQTQSVVIKTPISEAKNTAAANSSKYPLLNAKTTVSSIGQISTNNNVGDIVTVPGVGQRKITQKTISATIAAPGGYSSNCATGVTVCVAAGANSWTIQTGYSAISGYPRFSNSTQLLYDVNAQSPTYSAATDYQFRTAISTANSTLLDSTLDSEMNTMVKEKGGAVSIVSSSNPQNVDTAAAFSPPVAPSAAQIQAAAQSDTISSLTGAVTAQTAAERAAYLNYSSTKTPAANAAYQQVIADRNAATAALSDKLNTATDVAATIPNNPAPHSLDFTPLDQVRDKLSTTYPFNLPLSIGSYYSRLSGGSGTAPVFVLPLPGNNHMTVDLALFNPVAVAIRFLISILITVGAIYYIIHFYRGIS